VQQRRHNATTITTWFPLQVETPRDPAAGPYPDCANTGAVGSTPIGQPEGMDNVFVMTDVTISCLEDRFNLPNLHFGPEGALEERQYAVISFFTKVFSRPKKIKAMMQTKTCAK
jgi:hypothetical protein